MEMERSPHRSSLIALLAPLALLVGCAGEQVDQNPNMSVTQEKDIPIPQQFQFDKENSFAYIQYSDPKSEGYFRSSREVYYGDQQIGTLVPWFNEQMSVDGWTPGGARTDADKNILTFTKRDETATIQLYRQFDTRFDRFVTFIVAEVHPTPTESVAVDEILRSAESPGLKVPENPEAGAPKGAAPKDASGPGSLDDELPLPEKGSGGIIRTPDRSKEAVTPPPDEEETEGSPAPAAARTGKNAPRGNKQVDNDEPGVDNTEESESGSEFTPDDEGS